MGPKPIDYASPGMTPPRRFAKGIFGWAIFIFLAVMLFVLAQGKNRKLQGIPFSDFDLLLRSGSIKSLTIEGDQVTGDLSAATAVSGGLTVSSFRTQLPSGVGTTWAFLNYVTENRHSAQVNVDNSQNLLLQVLVPLIPWLLIFGFIWFFVFRQLRAGKLQRDVANANV